MLLLENLAVDTPVPKDGQSWGGCLWGCLVSPPNPPLQIHQRTVSSHKEVGLCLDLPEDVLSFTDIRGLVFGNHT